MGINKGQFVHKAKIYAAMFIMLSMVLVDIVFRHYIEEDKRQQARYNLEHSLSCLKSYEDTLGKVDFYGMKVCAKKMRTSTTGDMYVLDSNTKEFLYDGSTDVPHGQKIYFTKDSVGKYFTEWYTAEKALDYLLNGSASDIYTKASYNFDGNTEWLEYCTYTTRENESLVIVQGIQSDEAESQYEVPRMVTAGAVMMYVLWLLSTSIQRRRHDDTGC